MLKNTQGCVEEVQSWEREGLVMMREFHGKISKGVISTASSINSQVFSSASYTQAQSGLT
jgi:hypothetical protein